MICASWGPLGTPLGPLLGPVGGLLGRLFAVVGPSSAMLGPSGPSWEALRRLPGPSGGDVGPPGRLFGGLLGRLGRALGVPRGASEGPTLSGNAPFYRSVSLFGSVRCFGHLWEPVWFVFRASPGALGPFLTPFPRLFGPSGSVFDPSHKLRVPKIMGRRCLPPQGRSIE